MQLGTHLLSNVVVRKLVTFSYEGAVQGLDVSCRRRHHVGGMPGSSDGSTHSHLNMYVFATAMLVRFRTAQRQQMKASFLVCTVVPGAAMAAYCRVARLRTVSCFASLRTVMAVTTDEHQLNIVVHDAHTHARWARLGSQ